jgi:hypothetical protein
MRLRIAVAALAGALLIPAGADGASKKNKPKAFASCTALNAYAEKHALKIFGPGGIPFRFGFPEMTIDDFGGPMPPMAPGAEGAPQQDSGGELREGTDFSGTNNQEEGVDEPDFVKTDGKRLYVAVNSTVYVFDVTGEPKLVGELKLKGYGHQLLVSGDRLLALTTYYDDPVLAPQPDQAPDGGSDDQAVGRPFYYQEPATRLFEIDVSDASKPTLLNTLTVEGFYTSARLLGSTARVVVSTPPDPVYMTDEETIEEESRASTWIPDGVLRDRVKNKRKRKRMVACDDVRRLVKFAGPGMLTLLTLDLEKGLDPVDSDSLMTDAQTIYASKKSLFVATQRWFDPETNSELPDGPFTAVHKFDISGKESASYRATGQVRGFALNQFALSEHDGNLRVATTEQPPWREGAEQRESESFVTVLGPGMGELGRVGGLGRGERIFAVRMLGDKGYVVTFRQVDPLYTLDLSAPEKPTVKGELKILGFSSYLHPIGGELLLGIGQDATEQGQATGAQVSLFDVSDLSAPKRLFARSLGEYASSAAEYDHHAFLYWAPTKLSVLPLNYWGSEEDQFAGAVGLEIDRTKGITEVGKVQHEKVTQYGYDWLPPIERSIVVRDRLITVSQAGVLASALDTLAPGGFTPFPQPENGGGGGGDVVVNDAAPPKP